MAIDRESALYARLLSVFSITGMVLLVLTFFLYLSGALPSQLTPERVSQLWQLSAEEFREETGEPTGWAWIKTIGSGQGIAFAALVFLALATPISLIVLAPVYAKHKDYWYLAVVVLETIVLVVAASGIAVVH